MKKILPLLFGWLISVSAVMAQTDGKYELAFKTKSYDCATKKLQVQLQVRAPKAANRFRMGNATIRFNYDPQRINKPKIVSQDNFSNQAPANDNAYAIQNSNGSSEGTTNGLFSFQIFLNIPTQAKLVEADFITMATIEFDVSASDLCYTLIWNDQVTSPVTVLYAEDVMSSSMSSPYEMTEGTFQNLANCYTLPIATVSPNPLNIAEGTTLALSASTVAGATYSWAGPASFSSTSQNISRPSATTAMSGIYSVRVNKDNCEGPAATASVSVSASAVTPTPCSISASAGTSASNPCTGTSINFTASGSNSYSWTGPNGFTSTLRNPTLAITSADQAGRYFVTIATAAGSTCSVSTYLDLAVRTPPSAVLSGGGTIEAGGSTELSLTLTGSPQWSLVFSDGFSTDKVATSPYNRTIRPAVTTTYTVIVQNTCGSVVSNGVTVTVNPTTPTPTLKPDLSLTKKVSNKAPAVGDNITYTITLSNTGQGNATGVEVTDILPAGVQYVSSSSSSYNPTTGVWTVGTVAKSTQQQLIITVRVIATGVWFNQAEVSKQNETDVDSTPNNGIDAEDDIDRVCFSVPVKVCPGDQVVMNVPAAYTNVVWYKDGKQISNTGNRLVITASGSYTFTASNSTCPTEGCCPMVVSFDNCCPEPKCVPFVILKVK